MKGISGRRVDVRSYSRCHVFSCTVALASISIYQIQNINYYRCIQQCVEDINTKKVKKKVRNRKVKVQHHA